MTYHRGDPNFYIPDGTICFICQSVLITDWTDCFGEAYCIMCGTPYNIHKNFKNPRESSPLIKKWIPIVRSYWETTRKFVQHGNSLSDQRGKEDFHEWVIENYPEMLVSEKVCIERAGRSNIVQGVALLALGVCLGKKGGSDAN